MPMVMFWHNNLQARGWGWRQGAGGRQERCSWSLLGDAGFRVQLFCAAVGRVRKYSREGEAAGGGDSPVCDNAHFTTENATGDGRK